MSSQVLHSGENLIKSLLGLPPGIPVTSAHLERLGISRQSAHGYTKSGWLKMLGYGYYQRLGDTLTETGIVSALGANGVQVHISGRSALALKGFTHYLSFGEKKVTLCGPKVRKLPDWIQSYFTFELESGHLFAEEEKPKDRLGVSRLNNTPHSPYVSEPERAVLELLDQVPKRQTLDEAKLIMESLHSLRSAKLQKLLELCKKIKVKRLFWSVARELDSPFLVRLDPSEVDFGSKSNYTLTGEKTLVLRHPYE